MASSLVVKWIQAWNEQVAIETVVKELGMSEQEKVKLALSGIKIPSFVANMVHAFDMDSEGEPAVRVWVVVQDDTIQREEFDEPLHQLRKAIIQALRDAKIEGWPFVRFREKSEQEELNRAGYAYT